MDQVGAGGSFVTRPSFLFEVLIMAFIPLPYFDVYITLSSKSPASMIYREHTYLLSEFMLVLMVLRICFLIRAIINFDIYNNTFSKKLFKAYG